MIAVFAAGLLAIQQSEESPGTMLARASDLFHQGDYADAAKLYDRLMRQGNANGPFFLNQGNAHFLAGNLPAAILAYRRAERFIPHDRRLLDNLAAARSRIVSTGLDQTSLAPARFTEPFLLRLSIVAYAFGWGALGIGFSLTRKSWTWAGGLAIILGIACAGLAYWEQQDRLAHPLAVLAQDRLPLRQGNGLSYPVVDLNNVPVTLAEATELILLARRPNGWAQVRLPDGVIGWLPLDALLIDEP